MDENSIKSQIDRIQTEVYTCGTAYYQWKSIHNVCSQATSRPRTLDAHPTFWVATLSALQSTYVLGLAKLFDKPKKSFSLDTVLRNCKKHTKYFNNSARASRMMAEGKTAQEATSFTSGGFEPSESDFEYLLDCLNITRETVKNIVHPIRHQVIAHTQLGVSFDKVNELYNKLNISQIEQIIDEGDAINQLLWGNWVNGHEFERSTKTFKPSVSLESETKDLVLRASVE